jgi:hypothetical protein
MATRVSNSVSVTPWGQLLTMPTQGYLEAWEGPVPLRDVEWIELSTRRIKGGLAGRPRQMLDIKDDLLSHLHGMAVAWELRDSTWSMERIFEEEPVEVVRILNPFVRTAALLS